MPNQRSRLEENAATNPARQPIQQVHLLGFQKAKYSFKKRPQFFLVVFIVGEFAESHPLLLICQIGLISCGISSCTIGPYPSHVASRTYAAAVVPTASVYPSIACVN